MLCFLCTYPQKKFRGALKKGHLAFNAGTLILFVLFSWYGEAAGDNNAIVYADRPNELCFTPRKAQFIRFVIHAANTPGAPCLDELEVYGEEGTKNLALLPDAEAAASSCIAGYVQHAVRHLNDGVYGNANSWIGGEYLEQWAQIRLPQPERVAKIIFSRDRNRDYNDRVPVAFEVMLSLDGESWESAVSVTASAGPVLLRSQSRHAADLLPVPPPPSRKKDAHSNKTATMEDLLVDAFLAEEHAWVKTFGRADLDPRLVPYNGRVKEYPRHVGDDVSPLPLLPEAPSLDAFLTEASWQFASRSVVRVAWPYDFEQGPLVNHICWAGHYDGMLYLGLQFEGLLSAHAAILSLPDMTHCGAVTISSNNLVFREYQHRDKISERPVEGRFNKEFTRFAMRIPLEWFPGCGESGLRIGLGMGGRHTSASGKPILLYFAPFALAETGISPEGAFQVRATTSRANNPVALRVQSGETTHEVQLESGASQMLSFPGEAGLIGLEATVNADIGDNQSFVLHLFKYSALSRTLMLFEELVERFEKRGIEASKERALLEEYRSRHTYLNESDDSGDRSERTLFREVREAKRRLLLRDPEIESIGQVLFVKRHPFEPSHNYSDYFDSPYRPGGGIYILHIPQQDNAWMPEQARLTELFLSGNGIARNPMADFDLSQVYFSYRPNEEGHYHVMAMNPDGGDLRQLTDGPFHDLWPCPLPDGDLAVISTRCTARFICWRPQASVLFRMKPDGTNFTPLSFANLTEWATSVMADGRIIWTRSEYQDKGADFGHTLWAIRPDGSYPELVFGNTIIQPNGYANGRQVPGTQEFSCTLISHFGDLNGPIALVDTAQGRFNPKAITSLTPEVPWPGMWPDSECFREAFPIARDYFLCSHAPRNIFGIYLLDRYGNRELLYLDPSISSMCPTPFRMQPRPPILAESKMPTVEETPTGEFIMQDVYAGIAPMAPRGAVKYLRIVEEVRAVLEQLPDGAYRSDHPEFQDWYATPVHKVSGPHGWPTYVAKASHGIVSVETDGSAHFRAPAGKVLYFQALDENFNELQRMRSVVQLQPGEVRSCIGCHESREQTPVLRQRMMAKSPQALKQASWEGVPFSYEKIVQPVLDAHCIVCHNADHPKGLNYTGVLDKDKVPASYRTLIEKGLVHYADMGWNSGGCEKTEPLSLGTLKSKLWHKLDGGHQNISLSTDEMLRLKTWIDLNCPLWPDYRNRLERPGETERLAQNAIASPTTNR